MGTPITPLWNGGIRDSKALVSPLQTVKGGLRHLRLLWRQLFNQSRAPRASYREGSTFSLTLESNCQGIKLQSSLLLVSYKTQTKS